MDKYFDISYVWGAFPQLLPFLKITFLFVFISTIIGLVIGFMITWLKLSSVKAFQWFANTYITILRCTPSIVLLFLVYYGIPQIGKVFAFNLNDIPTIYFVITAFSLQFGAVMAEVIRASYLSIDRGQFEAGLSAGMHPVTVLIRIIVPQAIVSALPNFANSFISLLQEGALAYTIGFIDVVGKAELIIASNYNTHALEIYIALALIYWILSILIEHLFKWIEEKANKSSLQGRSA